MSWLIAFVTIFLAAAAPNEHAFEEATTAATNRDFAKARELYRVAAAEDPNPRQRDLAAVRLSNIEWRIFHEPDAAEKDLAMVRDESEQAAPAWIQRARLNADLRENYAASREAAQHALAVAKQDIERANAVIVHANASIEPAIRARLAGRCETDVAQLQYAKLELGAVVAKAGPITRVARLLLDAALLTDDGPAALAAWRGYYGPIATSSLLAPAGATLAEKLPAWKGADATSTDRRAVGLALADSRFFDESALVLRDPCAKNAVEADARVADIVAYAAAMRSLIKATDEYYRNVALQRAKPDALQKIADDAGRSLWQRLSWSGKTPQYSIDALGGELGRRFGTYAGLGYTSRVFDLHLGHRVLDEERQVSQYGRTASLHFIALDGMASNGFSSWVKDGSSGDGGWANPTAIYQVRPLYANGPLLQWLDIGNADVRAQHDREMADEAKLDEQRVAHDPYQLPRGVALRLDRQYRDRTAAALRASGLKGDELRAAFVAKVTSDTFESSIWNHEGRHAIDKKYDHLTDGAELEFRAKLSEVALAPAPREAVTSIAADMPPTTPHGRADRRIGELLIGWMKAHAAEIADLDPARPMLLQIDKLTDDQLREAFRSMDPLARASSASTAATSSGRSTPR